LNNNVETTKHLKLSTKGLTERWENIFEKNIIKFFINKKILDLGCLDGYGTNLFINYGAKNAAGIDIDERYIDEAIKTYPKINFKTMDVENVELINEFKNIDVVSCLGLIYLLKDPYLFLNILSNSNEIKTVLIETVNNTEHEDLFNFQEKKKFLTEHDYNFRNINNIETIFTKNKWNLVYKKIFKINFKNNRKIKDNLHFGDRVILVFERQL
jgi:SAM-dependent methyltransferase